MWYFGVIKRGYRLSAQDGSLFAFFPFYPLSTRFASVFVKNKEVPAVIVANVCLLLAGFLFHQLMKREGWETSVRRMGVLCLMFCPIGFFFSCASAESTFLLLSIGAFLAARQSRWPLAGLLGMAASATKEQGLLLIVPLFVELFSRSGIHR